MHPIIKHLEIGQNYREAAKREVTRREIENLQNTFKTIIYCRKHNLPFPDKKGHLYGVEV